MHTNDEAGRGPSLGEPAPLIETLFPRKSQKKDSSKGSWIILVSHPHDLLPLFKTRTINYILCKRRTKVLMLRSGGTDDGVEDGNFLMKYITRHNVAFLDDPDKAVAAGYGLDENTEEVKGAFVIDPAGILRMKLYFDHASPRNFYEILKLLDTLQEADSQRKRKPAPGVWKRRLSIAGRTGPAQEEA